MATSTDNKFISGFFLLLLCSIVVLVTLRNQSMGIQKYQYYSQQNQRDISTIANDNTTTRRTETERKPPYDAYHASSMEEYIFQNMEQFRLNEKDVSKVPSVCNLYTDATNTATILSSDNTDDTNSNSSNSRKVYDVLQQHIKELEIYDEIVSKLPVRPDVRHNITETDKSYCTELDVHPDGLEKGIFATSGQISFLPRGGYVEPLLPPMRHPKFCLTKRADLMNLKYLIHDFVHICTTSIQPKSRTVFVDLGASLNFHRDADAYTNPSLYILRLYSKFGIIFDHIYAYEATPIQPRDVYDKLPTQFYSAYHWINIPVSSDPQHYLNPFKLLLDNYTPDDFIVVKLDIDTPVIEMALIDMLVTDDRCSNLIDQLYFEHHVVLKDLLPWWGYKNVNGSVAMSLQLFRTLRDKGIAAHYWP